MTDNISGVLKTPDITKQTLQLRNSLKSCHKGDIENIYNNNENGLIYDEDHSLIDLSNSFSYSDEQRKDDESSMTTEPLVPSYNHSYIYFPHGIINPNYPGFQHLAYTLSEYFVRNDNSFISNVNFEESDSEVTDDEMVLSDDSSECLNGRVRELYKVENVDKTNGLIKMNENVEKNFSHSNNSDIESIVKDHCYTDLTDVRKKYVDKTYALLIENQMDHGIDHMKDECIIENNINFKTGVSCTTPDILLENNHKYYNCIKSQPQRGTQLVQNRNILTKKDGCPDLLRGVSPIYSTEITVYQSTTEYIHINDLINQNKALNSEDISSLDSTPINIIGDFGEEVEREFSLWVTGYKCLSEKKENFDELIKTDKKLDDVSNKIVMNTTDASCTFIGDKIDMSKYQKVSNESTNERKNMERLALNPPIMNAKKNTYCRVNLQQYRKASHDDRQLPPVTIEYKKYQQKKQHGLDNILSSNYNKDNNVRERCHIKKGQSLNTNYNSIKNDNNNYIKFPNTVSKYRKVPHRNYCKQKATTNSYHEMIVDKELIINNSRYVKYQPLWTQYLTEKDDTINATCKNNDGAANKSELFTTSLIELFEAYKIGTEGIDQETLQQHLQMAKEIEKKRRDDRKEIHRRLVLGSEHQRTLDSIPVTTDNCSDTEANSSDSETCGKLMRCKQSPKTNNLHSEDEIPVTAKMHCPHYDSTLIMPAAKKNDANQDDLYMNIGNASESDFFTIQAKLQIETRMALSQAKTMAERHMEKERLNRRVSPITTMVRESLESIGVNLTVDTRRISRQMLTNFNVSQLQMLVDQFHKHIEDFNEMLVKHLMERDELHLNQDLMLTDIENLTCYIAPKEHISG